MHMETKRIAIHLSTKSNGGLVETRHNTSDIEHWTAHNRAAISGQKHKQ